MYKPRRSLFPLDFSAVEVSGLTVVINDTDRNAQHFIDLRYADILICVYCLHCGLPSARLSMTHDYAKDRLDKFRIIPAHAGSTSFFEI
jgi:hypothetical protein